MFRIVRHMILDEEYFEIFKYTEPRPVVLEEFTHQFLREFNFDATMQTQPSEDFNFDQEWQLVAPLLAGLERRFPVLQTWHGY